MAGDFLKANQELNEGNPQVTQEMFIQIASTLDFATDEEISEALKLTPKEDVCTSYFYTRFSILNTISLGCPGERRPEGFPNFTFNRR